MKKALERLALLFISLTYMYSECICVFVCMCVAAAGLLRGKSLIRITIAYKQEAAAAAAWFVKQ